MAKRTRLSSGAIWEYTVGYSRAIRVGNYIEISGTTASSKGSALFPGDAYGQTKYILEQIKSALERADSRMEDVVRTRIYTTDIKFLDAIGKAHGEFFQDIRPCTTMVEVQKLVLPDLVVEIEATAIADE